MTTQLLDLTRTLPTDAFDYALPEERIAQTPLEVRDASRLLHIPEEGDYQDRRFTDLPDLLREGDLLVANETRVRAARLKGTRADGGAAELLVLAPDGDGFSCLVRPARRLAPGSEITIGPGLRAVIGGAATGHPGARHVVFSGSEDINAAIERFGAAPLPPYIRQGIDNPSRYQTTYAAGAALSAAAPTAGLHFTDAVRARLKTRGIGWETLRLEVGLGTFAPIRAERIADHVMHHETYELGAATAAAVNQTRDKGGRVIAVGTTAMRVLETCATDDGVVFPGSGETGIYLMPGHRFRVVDGLLTNFHQPRSSLLVLLAAFVGVATWRDAYDHALGADYRFLSFGDCMLCWNAG